MQVSKNRMPLGYLSYSSVSVLVLSRALMETLAAGIANKVLRRHVSGELLHSSCGELRI